MPAPRRAWIRRQLPAKAASSRTAFSIRAIPRAATPRRGTLRDRRAERARTEFGEVAGWDLSKGVAWRLLSYLTVLRLLSCPAGGTATCAIPEKRLSDSPCDRIVARKASPGTRTCSWPPSARLILSQLRRHVFVRPPARNSNSRIPASPTAHDGENARSARPMAAHQRGLFQVAALAAAGDAAGGPGAADRLPIAGVAAAATSGSVGRRPSRRR